MISIKTGLSLVGANDSFFFFASSPVSVLEKVVSVTLNLDTK
jgi:hypothetical protein